MQTLSGIARHSQDVKKSRFTAVAGPVSDEAAARDFLTRHADASANHNCWAWSFGQNQRFNDDGEPSGTAGKPILAAIMGRQLDGVVVIVSRWFGGVLLGSGGLVRAYGGTVAQCLDLADKVQLIRRTKIRFDVSFGDLALVKARIERTAGAVIEAEQFTDHGACLDCALPEESADAVATALLDLTRGRMGVHRP